VSQLEAEAERSPRVTQEALLKKQRGEHQDGETTGTQVIVKEKAVETALFIFQSLKMLLVISQ
jgi:hypothetical protein